MYKLSAPTIESSDSYTASVASVRSKAERAIYRQAAMTVQERCMAFDQLAIDQRFDDAKSVDYQVSELINDCSMVNLYDKQFSKNDGTENIRNSIRNAAPNNLCPYCGEGMVAQLDHYLPKSHFAGTTVHPANLVPCCSDCNFAKKAYKPGDGNPAVLHPYFDLAYDLHWLEGALEEGESHLPVITFSVASPQSGVQLEARLRAHMRVFDLYERFSTKAAQSLDNFGSLLNSDPGKNITLETARQHLKFMAIQQSGQRINSWEAVAHKAMMSSDWYLIKYLGLK